MAGSPFQAVKELEACQACGVCKEVSRQCPESRQSQIADACHPVLHLDDFGPVLCTVAKDGPAFISSMPLMLHPTAYCHRRQLYCSACNMQGGTRHLE
jgi:hypothetical protein